MSDNPRLHIRRFRTEDSERVRELNEAAMAETPEWIPDMPETDLQSIQQHYLEDEGEFLVGTVDGTIVATGAYTTPGEWKAKYVEVGDSDAELTRMRVDPDWQGDGVGTAIYHELEQRARSDGYQRFVLDTGTENGVARGFYETRGFECMHELCIDYEDWTIELALYEKPLDK